jgi:hypothetical protein
VASTRIRKMLEKIRQKRTDIDLTARNYCSVLSFRLPNFLPFWILDSGLGPLGMDGMVYRLTVGYGIVSRGNSHL